MIGVDPVINLIGRTLWGRASSLPVRAVNERSASPRDCGTDRYAEPPDPVLDGRARVQAPVTWTFPGFVDR